MIFTKKINTPQFASFSRDEFPYIRNHRLENGNKIFEYVISVKIDKSKIGTLDGFLEIRGFSAQKSREPITVKRSDVASSNFLKKISEQRMLQASQKKYEKKYFVSKYLDRSDYGSASIEVSIQIPSAYASSVFSLDLLNSKIDGSQSVIDTIQINHDFSLKQYDIPSKDFLLTTTRNSRDKIYATASTDDTSVGSFKFFIKRKTNTDFEIPEFLNPIQVFVDSYGSATAEFKSPDVDYEYTVLARPVSLLLKQEIGNFRQVNAGFKKNIKQIPFFMDSISDQSVSFKITGLDESIKKVFLYRQKKSDLDRSFVAQSFIRDVSTTISDDHRNAQYEYFYTLDYADSDGLIHTSPSEVVVPALKLDSLATLSVSLVRSPALVSSTTNLITGRFLTFNTVVNYRTETIYDQIITDLKKMGLESLLAADLEKTTNNLKPLTRVLVTRISQRTGIESDVGIFETGEIRVPLESDDVLSREKFIYRFEVAVRSAPEVLESITSGQNIISNNAANLKSFPDLASKLIGNRSKTSQTNFSAKFLSRSSIRGSELRYGDAANLSDLSFYAGRTGIFADVRVPFSLKTNYQIKNLKAETRNKGTYISWAASGDIKKVDFFEISIDGSTFYSHPTSGTIQVFHLGNIIPNFIKISAIVDGERVEQGASSIKVTR